LTEFHYVSIALLIAIVSTVSQTAAGTTIAGLDNMQVSPIPTPTTTPTPPIPFSADTPTPTTPTTTYYQISILCSSSRIIFSG
jgi:hypothetical protein